MRCNDPLARRCALARTAMVVQPQRPLGPSALSPIIDVRGFTKRYRKRTAIAGADLTLGRGELHGLIGPDGSGKSTLMKAIAGVLTFDAGTVTVCASRLDSERAAESVKDRIGFMPQGLGHHLYPNLSVEENVDFFARLRLLPEGELARRKEKLLAMTRLARFRQRAAKLLSGGMKQKLGLICTLIHEPEILILDEPTTGVDPVSRRDFWEIIGELLCERGLTALISTAYLDEASRFDRVTLLHAGRVIARGEPEEITGRLGGTVVSLEAADPAAALQSLKRAFPQTDILGSRLQVLVPEPDAGAAVGKVSAILPDTDARTLTTSPPQLEDAFCSLLQQLAPERAHWTPGPDEEGPKSPLMANGAAIEAAGLTKSFGRFLAVENATFVIPPGEIFGLLGANGAGKTTVIKMLTGILEPTRGTGLVAGADMRTAPRTVKEHIGYMSQSFSLYGELSVLENIRLYAGIYGLTRRVAQDRADWVLTLADLHAHERDRAESLPMGMRQRLALGCALVHRPRVLFLDEPTAGVDALGRRQIWELLFHLSRGLGVAILVTTHYMSEAERCDRLALMHAGRIVAIASPGEMKRASERELGQVLEVSADDPRRAWGALRSAGFAGAARFGRYVHLYSQAPAEDAMRIRSTLAAAGVRCLRTSQRSPSMEDVFVSRVRRLEAADERIEVAAAGGGP